MVAKRKKMIPVKSRVPAQARTPDEQAEESRYRGFLEMQKKGRLGR